MKTKIFKEILCVIMVLPIILGFTIYNCNQTAFAETNTMVISQYKNGQGKEIIKWVGCEDCNYYDIYINGNLFCDNFTKNYINYNDLIKNIGENNIKIVANFDNNKIETKKTITKYGKLDVVNLNLQNENLTWKNIENAKGYEIVINGCLIDSCYVGNEINLSKYFKCPVKYKIQVKALGKDFYLSSKYSLVKYQKQIKLDTPQNLRTIAKNKDVYLVWDNVDYANEYQIEIEDKLYNSNVNLIKINDKIDEIRNYNINVIAHCDDFIDSEKSNIIYRNKSILDTPILKFENNKLSWNKVENAYTYTVRCNDKILGIEIFDCEIDLTKEIKDYGNFCFYVCANTNGNYCSSEIAEIKYQNIIEKELENPHIKDKVLYYDKNDEFNKVCIKCNDKIYKTEANGRIELKNYMNEAKKYYFEIYFLTDNDNIKCIPYECSIDNFIKLNSPKFKVENNILKINKQYDFISYDIFVDSKLLIENFEGDAINLLQYLAIANEYEIGIVANGKDYYLASEKSSISYKYFDKLQKPMGKIEDKNIEFNSIKNALSYDIYVNDEKVLNTTDITINIDKYLIDDKKYKFDIIAVNNVNYYNSEPLTLYFDNSVNLEGYNLTINGDIETVKIENFTQYKSNIYYDNIINLEEQKNCKLIITISYKNKGLKKISYFINFKKSMQIDIPQNTLKCKGNGRVKYSIDKKLINEFNPCYILAKNNNNDFYMIISTHNERFDFDSSVTEFYFTENLNDIVRIDNLNGDLTAEKLTNARGNYDLVTKKNN